MADTTLATTVAMDTQATMAGVATEAGVDGGVADAQLKERLEWLKRERNSEQHQAAPMEDQVPALQESLECQLCN